VNHFLYLPRRMTALGAPPTPSPELAEGGNVIEGDCLPLARALTLEVGRVGQKDRVSEPSFG